MLASSEIHFWLRDIFGVFQHAVSNFGQIWTYQGMNLYLVRLNGFVLVQIDDEATTILTFLRFGDFLRHKTVTYLKNVPEKR